jgi:hypothetical protein
VKTTKVEDDKSITTCVAPDEPTPTLEPESEPEEIFPPLNEPQCNEGGPGAVTMELEDVVDSVTKACGKLIDEGKRNDKENDKAWFPEFFDEFTLTDEDSKTSRRDHKISMTILVDWQACGKDKPGIDFK